jgi:hypothetical protein
MRKLLFVLPLLIAFVCQGQEKKTKDFDSKKHEIKFGGIKMLAGPIFEGTYEYIYSKDFTFGSSLLLNLQSDNSYTEDFSITPFARFYFQETQEYGAKGFFVEGFAKYVSGKNDVYYSGIYGYKPEKFTAGALGISLGKKWVNRSGFVLELLAGAGRTLGNSKVAPDAFFRGDINIGYRF